MIYSHEVEMMCPVAQGANHGPAPIPEEAKTFEPKVVFVDDENQISRCTNYERHGRLEDM